MSTRMSVVSLSQVAERERELKRREDGRKGAEMAEELQKIQVREGVRCCTTNAV